MSRAKCEVPWNVQLPPICAGCLKPAVKTLRLEIEDTETQRVFASRPSGPNYLDPKIPCCEACFQEQKLAARLGCAAPLLIALFLTGWSVVNGGIQVTVVVAGISVGALSWVLLRVRRAALELVRVVDTSPVSKSMTLSFRNPAYRDKIVQHNFADILHFALRNHKPLPVPVEQAIDVVTRQIDENDLRAPNTLRGYFERAQLHLQGQMYEKALADLRRVAQLTGTETPYYPDILFFRGQAHMHLGNLSQAQRDLERYVGEAKQSTRKYTARRWLKELKSRRS